MEVRPTRRLCGPRVHAGRGRPGSAPPDSGDGNYWPPRVVASGRVERPGTSLAIRVSVRHGSRTPANLEIGLIEDRSGIKKLENILTHLRLLPVGIDCYAQTNKRAAELVANARRIWRGSAARRCLPVIGAAPGIELAAGPADVRHRLDRWGPLGAGSRARYVPRLAAGEAGRDCGV
jgi:hypothetical protein